MMKEAGVEGVCGYAVFCEGTDLFRTPPPAPPRSTRNLALCLFQARTAVLEYLARPLKQLFAPNGDLGGMYAVA